jgi:heptaprenyl diphosphate synthase
MNENRVGELARLALLIALATAIHTVEAILPVTVLWFRFGFANIIGLATLYLFGFKSAVTVTIGRIFLGSLITGLFGSPAFILSLAGGSFSILVMGLAHHVARAFLSEVGISILGAVSHSMAQLAVAYLVLIRNEGVLLLAPVMILAAVATGFINGVATRLFVQRFRQWDAPDGFR